MQLALKLCVISFTFQHSDARPSFVSRIPNGNGVTGVVALGHVNSVGGGATNAFGEAFEAAGTSWTKELCESDSDGDGATNGEELGDPCCTWTASTGFADSSQSPTHPAVANSFTTDQLAAMTCGGEADVDSVASSGAASSSSTSSSSASGSQSTTSSSSGSSSVDVVAPEEEPRFSPVPKLEPTPQSPATSGVDNLQSVLVTVYCLSAAILLAL